MDRISVKSRGRVTVTRQAHNLKIVGAIPAPATSSDGMAVNVSYSLKMGDRIVNTSNLIQEARDKVPVNPDYFREEINKLSMLINEELPLLKKYFDSEVNIFFFNDSRVQKAYSAYSVELKSFSDFVLIELPKQKDLFEKKLSEYRNLTDLFYHCEFELIKEINRSRCVYKNMK